MSTCTTHSRTLLQPEVPVMKPIEAAIVEILQISGPCCLDDIVTSLPNSSWGEVFAAIDRMSRNGRLLLHQRSYSAYQVSLRSQISHSTSSRIGQTTGNVMPMSHVATL